MAPELREGLRYSYPIDVYALGVILLELFSIFSTQQERVTVILRASDGILPTSLRDNYSGKKSQQCLSSQKNIVLRHYCTYFKYDRCGTATSCKNRPDSWPVPRTTTFI